MFKKIEISNIGRFKSAKTDGDNEFLKKNTFIYGKNTFGKSTLTAIFRSLKENKPDYIVGRQTIGTQKQLVKIVPDVTTPVGEYRYQTDEGKWSAEYDDIIIFDGHFVRESVYTQSQQIGQEQQKNIESFMLGSMGLKYNTQITAIDEKIGENTKTQKSISTEYSRSQHLLGRLSFEEFLELTKLDDVDTQIDKAKKGFDQIKNFELISSKLSSVKALLAEFCAFDTTAISAKLSVNSELITKHFEKHVNKDETKQVYSAFLQTGSRMRTRTKNEQCPFCTQEIKTDAAKEFLNTIDLIYNENYRTLQQSLKKAREAFTQDTFSCEIQKIKTDLQQAGHVFATDFSDILALLKTCEKALIAKQEDLSSDLDVSIFANLALKASDHITAIDTEIVKFKNPEERKAELDKSWGVLRANKERFSSWEQRCDEYLKAKKENGKLKGDKDALWKEYLEYAETLSTKMLTDINDVLHACNCDFSIQTFQFKGNQRQDLLVLSMDNKHEILNEGDDLEMTVKNSLSDSDKWVLALAFFLSTVKNDPTVQVVVMDDPVSSFDSERKRIILGEIMRILDDTDKQLILLTHETGFYHLLHAEKKGDGQAAFLKISFDKVDGSDLTVCNPDRETEFMNEFRCWIDDMRNASNSHNLSFVKNSHSHIRLVIEHILKAKYPLELTGIEKTLGEMLDKLEQASGPYVASSPRARINAILANQPHHDNSGTNQYPVHQLGIEDYKKDIKDAFQVIKLL